MLLKVLVVQYPVQYNVSMCTTNNMSDLIYSANIFPITYSSQVHKLHCLEPPSRSSPDRYTLYTSSATDLHLPLRLLLQRQSYAFC